MRNLATWMPANVTPTPFDPDGGWFRVLHDEWAAALMSLQSGGRPVPPGIALREVRGRRR
jgi:hypothetical protein